MKLEPKEEVSSGKENANIHFYPNWPVIEEHTHIHVYPTHPPYQAWPGAQFWPSHFSFPATTKYCPLPYEQAPFQPLVPPGYEHVRGQAHPSVPFVTTDIKTEIDCNLSENTDEEITKKLKRSGEPAVTVGNDTGGGDSQVTVGDTLLSEEHDARESEQNTEAYQSPTISRTAGYNFNLQMPTSETPEGDSSKTSTKACRGTKVHGIVKTEAIAASIASTNDAGLIYEVPVWDDLRLKREKRKQEAAIRSMLRKQAEKDQLVKRHESLNVENTSLKSVLERDDWQLKREKRKQNNREAAIRSRLRKEAENDQLVKSYESLNVENMSLKSELSRLMGYSEKLRIENAALSEKLRNVRPRTEAEMVSIKIEL